MFTETRWHGSFVYQRSADLDLKVKSHAKKRSVTFCDETVIKHSTLEKEPLHSTWYSSRDLRSFRDDIRFTLKMLRRFNGISDYLDQELYCLRGLEGIDERGSTRKTMSRIHNIIQSVLEFQQHQRSMGISDPKGIQVHASACSRKSRDRALLLAKMDEKHTHDYQLREESLMHSSSPSLGNKVTTIESNQVLTAKLELNFHKQVSFARTA